MSKIKNIKIKQIIVLMSRLYCIINYHFTLLRNLHIPSSFYSFQIKNCMYGLKCIAYLDCFIPFYTGNKSQAICHLTISNSDIENNELHNLDLDNEKLAKVEFTFILDALEKIRNNFNIKSDLKIKVFEKLFSSGFLYMQISTNSYN